MSKKKKDILDQIKEAAEDFEGDAKAMIETAKTVIKDMQEAVKPVLIETSGSVTSSFATERLIADNKGDARALYDKSRFGALLGPDKIQYSLHEGLFLLERGKMDVFDNKKALTFDTFVKRARKVEPNFWIRYSVFKDLRNRGYIVKTALKFGADFRVYERGIKPGEDHAKWIVYPVHEGDALTWYEFAAKNRVAHSTKKRLLLGIVDDESSVTYYECKWIRP
ncbi:MAG: tRNA-intron lyase [Nanoarchaeota archaeon]|nr:tRNA-intron lyase [Nanoarchaeota archaeon]